MKGLFVIIGFDITLAELVRGYLRKGGACRCLFCGQEYRCGDIYTFGSRLVDAQTGIGLHIAQAHGSVFEALLSGGKKVTGLTESQTQMMFRFFEGIPDREIAARGGVSASAVRYQRFHLREKARQAKVFLALHMLLEECAGQNCPAAEDEPNT